MNVESKGAYVPATLVEALDAEWLARALSQFSCNDAIRSVEVMEVIKTMASKVRITVTFERDPAKQHHLCLKGFLDDATNEQLGGITTMREAEFYRQIAPFIGMRTPSCAAVVVDAAAKRAILVMADLIAAGAHFCSVLEPMSIDIVAQTLEQMAQLHSRPELLQGKDWIPSRIETISKRQAFPIERLQALMHDDRAGSLPDRTLDANLLVAGLQQLAARCTSRAQTLLHGDCHAGNIYLSSEGPGFTDWQLIQRGCWALDVSYHIACMLPEEIAELEERALFEHYLKCLRAHGGPVLNADEAWEDYRCAQIYGYYHWAITTRVDPAITCRVFQRLGAAVTRHDSYRLLGL
jgi:aminoglycoside phosphotransferase (APT) family kinase protein